MEPDLKNVTTPITGFGVSREGSFFAWGALTGIVLTFMAIYVARKRF